MKKLTALIILLCMLFCIFACSKRGNNPEDNTGNDVTQGNTPQSGNVVPTIVVPKYKDYGRGTVDFGSLVYSRPNLQAIIDAFSAVTAAVEANEKSVSDQINDLKSLEASFSGAETMYTVAKINQSKDSSDEFWSAEFTYLSTNYPKLSQAVENLLVACAKSEHKASFESEYFDYSLDKYTSGGIYTDNVVSLMQSEAALEAEYSSLSTSTVEIVYSMIGTDTVFEGTVDEVIAMLREHFAGNDDKYKTALIKVNDLYEYKLNELSRPIYTNLVKVRRLIADELGYKSYSELAYDMLGYDYSANEMISLLSSIGQYVSPIASELEYTVFGNYFLTNVQPKTSKVTFINNLYKIYSQLGGDYADAFSYMLQHGLYDASEESENRFNGAFTTYIVDNASPFIFMTTSGFIRDYTTMAHEFGHFLDGYINYGEDDSLAIMEISSQALELLTLLKLKGNIHSSDYEYLQYYTLFMYINSVLMTNSFYAAFEHMVYQLSYDEITDKKLEDIVDAAFNLVYGDDIISQVGVEDVLITHTVIQPFYVESYVTSGIVSLDIFFAESSKTGKNGEGFKLYESLIYRESNELSFTQRLEIAGIDSPFEDGKAKETANNIYFYIVGKSYYKPAENDNNAA